MSKFEHRIHLDEEDFTELILKGKIEFLPTYVEFNSVQKNRIRVATQPGITASGDEEAIKKMRREKREERIDREVEENERKRKEFLEQLLPDDPTEHDYSDGFIMPNGDFYECGFQDHINLEHDLTEKGIILHPTRFNGSYDSEENNIVKLSGNQLCGKGMYQFCNFQKYEEDRSEIPLTREQAETIVKIIASKEHPEYVEIYAEKMKGVEIIEALSKHYEI